MNDTTLNPSQEGWSKQRWWITILFVFALHIGAVFGLNARVSPTQFSLPPKLNFSMITSGAVYGTNAVTDPWSSPTLLVLPSAEGFSAKTWITLPAPPHQFAVWDEPIRFLRRDTNWVSRSALEMVPIAGRRVSESPDRAPPTVAEPAEAEPLLPTQSTVRVSGGLESRQLVKSIEPLRVAHNDVLSNTVIEVMVNSAGYILGAEVTASSGVKSVDQWAVRLLDAARFNSLPRGSANAFGRITFQWATVDPAATNTPVFKP